MERVRQLLARKEPLKWLFDGDSITHGAVHTHGSRDYVQLFEERVRFELGRSQDLVLKSAISGQTTRDLLATFDWRMAQFRPHVVFIMVGMNDCSTGRKLDLPTFQQNLAELVQRVTALGALLVLQTTCPILPGSAPDREPQFDAYMQALRDAAAAGGLPLVDHTAYWRANPAKFYDWMANQFHPNEYGHRVFFRLVAQELGIWDPTSNCGRLFIP
jgi:lysophospholipase L1-like esterase